ncbi:MAG: hypothetical protein JNL67_22905 [Planctomycetaceae bacterium]|nr:hypothetical protein [Planctomycetaceae bacterium]
MTVEPKAFPTNFSAQFQSWLVMLPWPLMGIAVSWMLSLFESSGEAIFLFGGVTMILLLPLALFVDSVWLFGALAMLVWLSVLYLPLLGGQRLARLGINQPIALVCQSLFSATQAGLGFLIILGKQV